MSWRRETENTEPAPKAAEPEPLADVVEMESLSAEFQANLAGRMRESLSHKWLTGAWRKKALDPKSKPLEHILAGERLYDGKRGAAVANTLDVLPAAVKSALEDAMGLILEEMELHMDDCFQIGLKDALQKATEQGRAEGFQEARKALLELRQRCESRFGEMMASVEHVYAKSTANFEALVLRQTQLFELEYGAPARSEA